jgi:N6-adenosine-specific RNA methylase IME4
VIKVDSEFRSLIPPLTPDERAQLEANVCRDGCRDPLVLWKGILLDGHNRFEICAAHKIKYRVIDQECVDRADAKIWIIRNQFGRRNLTLFARAELALTLEPLIAARAKAKQRLSRGRGRQKGLTDLSNLSSTNTRREIAKAAGISEGTIDKARVIAARAPEAVKEKLRRGETTIDKEHKAIVQTERKAAQIAKIETAAALPDGLFDVIAADPPWAYAKRAEDATHRGAAPYPSMTVEEIAALPVGGRASADCILWLWTTNAFMEQAYSVARAWGFEVKTILTWVKDRMGTGDWLRGQTEHCLMAVRGRPAVNLTNQTTFLRGPLREHSRKPDEFFALVDVLCVGRKCELFAREQRPGWAAFGAELDQFARTA